jgi:hypothetical protein
MEMRGSDGNIHIALSIVLQDVYAQKLMERERSIYC